MRLLETGIDEWEEIGLVDSGRLIRFVMLMLKEASNPFVRMRSKGGIMGDELLDVLCWVDS